MASLPLIAEKDSEILDSQTHIWNHILNFINSGSLKCAVQLEIPDIIHKHGQPMTLTQLVNALPINNAKSTHLARLMRTLIHSGFFVITKTEGSDDEGYALAPPSILLLKDNPLSVRPFVLAMLDPILTKPWHNISEWFQNDDPTPFDTVHGMSLWDYAGKEPKLNHFFNDAMASDAQLVMNVVIKYCRGVFEGLNSLVDVGGGTGTVATTIAHAFPHLKCTVFDLPHVVQGLEGTKNLDYVGGDMFASIPPADALLLKWILHDWSDEESMKILKKCKESIPSKENGGKVIIIDMVVDDKIKDDKSIETQIFFDMLMMILQTGRERAEKDWSKLFFKAGFNDYKIIPILGLRSLIEVYP
ncbi:PREDICTED: trans-resveratrol di-O-methyltransferase-like [Ipomoea nil]|uniref:trans-resveratrol di-O-methyltransferase-like n=1 Tax=Ipomoea nil TaxID=35883 RepID=UPI000900D0FE|nr:PREDICTED: trans-resveratrol di-O-methyltransferase-like [Ipomoea nil]